MTRHATKQAPCLPRPSQTRCWHCHAVMLLFQPVCAALRHLQVKGKHTRQSQTVCLPAAGQPQEQDNMKFGCVLLVLGAAVPVLPCSTLGLDLAHWWQPA